eukprot:Skav213209  [mRNA]  locus=scaffold2826:535361:539203:- [translate_table: standard]
MATPGQLQMFNKLEVHEMFSVKEGPRIKVVPDEKVSNAVVLHTYVEDHTLGNLLRMELLRNEALPTPELSEAVLFAGYKVPHPLKLGSVLSQADREHMIELRVQTTPAIQPEAALRHAVKNLQSECSSMLDQSKIPLKLRKSSQILEVPSNGRMVPYAALSQESEAFSADDAEGFHRRLEADALLCLRAGV